MTKTVLKLHFMAILPQISLSQILNYQNFGDKIDKKYLIITILRLLLA